MLFYYSLKAEKLLSEPQPRIIFMIDSAAVNFICQKIVRQYLSGDSLWLKHILYIPSRSSFIPRSHDRALLSFLISPRSSVSVQSRQNLQDSNSGYCNLNALKTIWLVFTMWTRQNHRILFRLR